MKLNNSYFQAEVHYRLISVLLFTINRHPYLVLFANA